MPVRRFPPVRLSIDDIAFGGRGVGRLPDDGRAVFVPFVLPGEEVEAEVVAEHRRHVEARLVAVTQPASARTEPRCPYFGRCGGCSYQHADYATQLSIKRKQVADLLRRVGRLTFADATVRATVPSPEIYGYRNRITVHARDGALGFFTHGPGERALLDIEECPLAAPAVNTALHALRARYQRGVLPDGRNYTVSDDDPSSADTPRFFRQTNDGAASRLRELVRALALEAVPTAAARGHLIDAYCGDGFFARSLTADFQRITGIEMDRRAVRAAQAAALAAPHEKYLAGDVAAHLPAALTLAAAAETVLLVDPPAEGLHETVIAAIAARPPATLIYISCQPPTLARDLARLKVGHAADSLYELLSVTPLDMFPQTAEIEAVVHLRARSGDAAGF
ncbi:MAG: class I SAM-dependent RNA methyltransferase [Verrucomicrobia bacterium]|nr:class I SAM-dependent RNA methyltransferase [Verrucomicrobiota bacterium]